MWEMHEVIASYSKVSSSTREEQFEGIKKQSSET